MLNYREIVRLRSLGYNITEIANSLHSSRSTIREVLSRLEKYGHTWPMNASITNEKRLGHNYFPTIIHEKLKPAIR